MHTHKSLYYMRILSVGLKRRIDTNLDEHITIVMCAQRFLLYALDELAMAALRMRIRVPGEAVKPHEAHFKLHEEEVPVKNKVQRWLRV